MILTYGNIVGALISGISGLLGAGMDSSSQRKTNEANYQIAQMNNEFNEKMMEKQMAYNTEMWNKQNEYNDPSAQRQRLEDAGLNPYMMLDGGSAGIASSVNGVTPPTAQAVNMEAPKVGGQISRAITDALNYDLAKEKQHEEVKNLQQNRELQRIQVMKQLDNLMEDTYNKRLKNDLQKIQNNYAEDMMNADFRAKELDNQIRQQELVVKTAEAASIDKRISNVLKLQGAQLALLVAQGRLANNSAETEFYRMWKEAMIAEGQHLDNKMMRETWKDLRNAAKRAGYGIETSNLIDTFIDGTIDLFKYKLGRKFRKK